MSSQPDSEHVYNKESNDEQKKEESEVEKLNKIINASDSDLKNLALINTIYYIVLFLVIGMPIWYFTTSTYRAWLPFDEINTISSMKNMEFQLRFDLIYLNNDVSPNQMKDFHDKLINDYSNSFSSGRGLTFRLNGISRKANKKESELFSELNSLEELDEKLNELNSNLNDLKIYILNEQYSKRFNIENDLISLNNLYLSEKKKLADHLKSNDLNFNDLIESFDKKFNNKRRMPTKQELKVFNYDIEYEITFSLINEKPEKLKSNWNIDFCLKNYFQKIINQLSAYAKFSIKSQVLLYSEFDSFSSILTKKTDQESFYYIRSRDVPIMTNTIENRLGSRISDSSAFEFVTYIPSRQPMYILAEPQNQNSTMTNSFLIPRWGGVYILNQMDNKDIVQVDEPMKMFLTQFIDLIGVVLNKNTRNFRRSKLYKSEIFKFLLKKTLENQLNSINTLKSLSSLLTKISSMVIEDDIAKQVQSSVDSVKKSIKLAQDGKLDEAFNFSKIAFTSSEKAFFDPSLLEKLYFPEDQRFAVYIPLFIPVSIPILLSFKSLIQWYKKRKEKIE